jgi:cytochrome c oxidase subunit 2
MPVSMPLGRMPPMPGRWRLWVVAGAAAGLASGCAQGGATLQGQEIHHLYGIIFSMAVFVFVLVEGLLIWAIIRYRKRDDSAAPQTFGSNRALIAFFSFGFVLVAVLFPFGERALSFVEQQDPNPLVRIRLEAFQWEWTAIYMNEGIFTTGRTLHQPLVMEIPVDEPVSFTLVSRDVMHGFYIPAFLFMRNAIPGHPTTFTFTANKLGTYPGQCTEFCGLWHSKMNLFVKVVPQSDYATWVKRQVIKAFGGSCPPSGPTVHLTAKNTSWNTNCMAVRAGLPFTLTVANLDEGINHNFGIWPSLQSSFSGKGELFQTGKFPGVTTHTFQVSATVPLKPGRYYFQCDVHGVAMAGAFIVSR